MTRKIDLWYFFHEWKEWKIMQINFSGQNFSKKIFMDVFLKRFMSGFSTFCKKGAFFTMDIPFGYIENVFSYLFKMPMSKCFLPINFFPVTFSHIYSFWWSMLILPCQCNLRSLFLLSFTFNTSVAAELSSPSKHTVVWPNSLYSIVFCWVHDLAP